MELRPPGLTRIYTLFPSPSLFRARLLVVAVDHRPRRPARVRLLEHFFDRGEIILALRPVAIIFRPGLPAFPRIVEPRGEAFVLLLLRDVNEQLDEVGSAAGQLRLELVDLVIALEIGSANV